MNNVINQIRDAVEKKYPSSENLAILRKEGIKVKVTNDYAAISELKSIFFNGSVKAEITGATCTLYIRDPYIAGRLRRFGKEVTQRMS